MDRGCSGIISAVSHENASADTQTQLKWTEITQIPALSSGPHSFLVFLLRPHCCQIQVPVQHFADLPLPRPAPVQWIFSGIFCSRLGGTAPNLTLFLTPVYFATAAKTGC